MTAGPPATSPTAPTAAAPPAGDDPASALCPRCGYDLRGTTSDRCGECGLAIDREAVQSSGVPWSHRRTIGRVRAFVRTVWLVTVDSGRIRHELGKPHDPRDAAWFRRLNAGWVAAALVLAAGAAVAEFGLSAVAIQPFQPTFNLRAGRPLPGPLQDLAVPWSAGLTLLPAVPLYLIGLAAYWAGLGRSVMRVPSYPPAHRERARAVSAYASAPLAWLLPAMILLASAAGLRGVDRRADDHLPFLPATVLAVTAAAIGLAALALLGSLHRSGQWVARAHHGGAGRYAAGVLELLGRSVVGAVLYLGVIPWAVGFAWIVVDRFRP